MAKFLLWNLETRLFLRSTRTNSERKIEWNGKQSRLCRIESNKAEDGGFEVRKQHLLTGYFGLSSTEELKNDLVNYQHTRTSLTINCAAIVNYRFRFVAAYIDVSVVIELTMVIHGISIYYQDLQNLTYLIGIAVSSPCIRAKLQFHFITRMKEVKHVQDMHCGFDLFCFHNFFFLILQEMDYKEAEVASQGSSCSE